MAHEVEVQIAEKLVAVTQDVASEAYAIGAAKAIHAGLAVMSEGPPPDGDPVDAFVEGIKRRLLDDAEDTLTQLQAVTAQAFRDHTPGEDDR